MLQVAIVEWFPEEDGLSQVICLELEKLGYRTVYFHHDEAIPSGTDVVFTYGPYGKLMPILFRASQISPDKRPSTVHWNMEGLPDLRMPWFFIKLGGVIRSWIGRAHFSNSHRLPKQLSRLLAPWENRILRFRYVGDYHYAYKSGLLTVLADSSAIYANIHSEHGLPTVAAPWGTTPVWYEDLKLDRDVDVLWMGQRGSKRRSNLLEQLREELKRHGIIVHVADNEENPFIYGKERTEFLNRTKITLNLTRTWYDDNYSRFVMAIPNRSLVVSEPLLPHCPTYEPGTHFVVAPIDQLAETIIHYLQHEDERQQLVEQAYSLATTELTLNNSIKIIMGALPSSHRPF